MSVKPTKYFGKSWPIFSFADSNLSRYLGKDTPDRADKVILPAIGQENENCVCTWEISAAQYNSLIEVENASCWCFWMRGRQNCRNIQRFEHICTTLSGFLFRDLRCCRVYLRLLYQLKCLLESALADVYHLLPAPHFLRSWKGYWRFGEWMRGNIQDFQEISTRRLQSGISKERLCTAGQMDGMGRRPESKSGSKSMKWTWMWHKIVF